MLVQQEMKKNRNLYKTTKQKVEYPKEIYLSETDRITYVYKRDVRKTIIEVTNVSYEIKIHDNWITIIRYDSSHGYLHRHLVISLENSDTTPSTIGIEKKGTHEQWLTWSINDIKKHYQAYRKGFLQRSKILDIDN